MPTSTPPAHEMTEPTGPAGGDLEGTYPNPTLRAALKALLLGEGRVLSEYIANGAVTSEKLAAGVLALLLGAGRVITEYIANGAVTLEKLSAGVQAALVKPLEWQNLEAINAKVEPRGAPYATSLQVAVNPIGRAELRGAIKAPGTAIPVKTILFTVPVAARPSVDRLVILEGTALGAVLHVKTNGEVELLNAEINTTREVSLDGTGYAL